MMPNYTSYIYCAMQMWYVYIAMNQLNFTINTLMIVCVLWDCIVLYMFNFMGLTQLLIPVQI